MVVDRRQRYHNCRMDTTLAILGLFTVLFAGKLVYDVITYLKSPLRKLPGPRPKLLTRYLLGSIPEITSQEHSTTFLEWAKEYGEIFSFFGTFLTFRVVVANVEATRRILVTNGANYRKTPFTTRILQELTGKGLFMTYGDVHRHQRKMVQPAFGPDKINRFISIFVDKSNLLKETWRQKIKCSESGVAFISSENYTDLALDIIGLTAFNYEFDACKATGVENQLRKAYDSFLKVDSPTKGLVYFISSIIHWFPLPGKAQRDLSRRIIYDTVAEIIARQRLSKPTDEANDLLSIIINADEDGELTEGELVSHVLSFLVAGHETTSSALKWITYNLCKHPDVLRKLREEIDEKDLTYEELKKCSYLQAVIKESMRLHSTVPEQARISIEDDYLNGYFIPGGTVVLLAQNVISRLESNYEDPESFIPERWLEPNAKSLPYLHFSIGEANCIGQRFAIYEMMVIIATLFRVFDIQTELPHYTRSAVFVNLPTPDMNLRVSLRGKENRSE